MIGDRDANPPRRGGSGFDPRNAGADERLRERELPVRALGYVSSNGAARMDRQELKRQAAALHDFCAQQGWGLVGLVCDVERVKGKTRERPSLGYALGRLDKGDASCLVVGELGHLCRSVAELGEILDALKQVDARLVSLQPAIDTGTELGRAAARIVTGVSAWERAQRAERIRKGLTAARGKGAAQPTLEPELKRWIVRMRGAGMTLQAIADTLNKAEVPTVRGGATWRPSSVQAALGYKRPSRRKGLGYAGRGREPWSDGRSNA